MTSDISESSRDDSSAHSQHACDGVSPGATWDAFTTKS